MGLSSNQAAATGLDWSQDVLRNGGLEIPKPGIQARNHQQQRQHWPPLACPRCESNNTKFCYYNNYSKSQPRHFCKACRRHWTEGGTLRNVPVGGGRKNKRQKSTPTTSTANPGGSSAGNSDTNASIINSGSVTAQPQRQRKPSLPFAGDRSSSIFPEILRQVLLRPPAPPLQAEYGVASSFVGSLPAVDPPMPPQSQFAPTKPVIINSYTSIINPFSMSTTTSSSSSYPYVSMEGYSTSMDASIGSSWQLAPFPPPVPVSAGGVGAAVPDPCSVYWSGWEDDIAGFVPTELRLPTTNSDKTQQP